MAVKSDSPQIIALLKEVEKTFGRPIKTPYDFISVAARIEEATREHISDSTIKRLCMPGLRYDTVSDRTLNVLSVYVGYPHFEAFCGHLQEEGVIESELVSGETCVKSEDLKPGAMLRIAWLPDRECTLKYLGNRNFIVIDSVNAKINPGDTFQCSTFIQGRQLLVDNLVSEGRYYDRYGMGLEHGLTQAEVIE